MTTNAVKTTVHDPLELEVLADGLGFPEGPCIAEDGTVYAVDIDRATIVRADGNGGATDVASPGGGPNGMALRADGTVVVANNGGFLWTQIGDFRIPIDRETHTNEPPGFEKGWIEQVDLTTGDVTVLHDSCNGRTFARSQRRGVRRGRRPLVHRPRQGPACERRSRRALLPAARWSAVQEIAFPLLGPNGVGLSPDGRTVYAAETHTGRLWAWALGRAGRGPAERGFAGHPPRRGVPRRHAVLVRLARRRGGRAHRHRSHRRRHRGDHAGWQRDRRPPDRR